ncbi:major facilitator superfamily domain-containing protein [Suillus spraguei]|nr:major facilitator superfamily domain-containing protein [Suillus spraguei]
MIVWGIVMTLMCLVKSYQSLVVARVFLGLAEAGLFPGVNYYICLWYPRSERSKRIAIFFSAASVAGAFGGLLAYGIERMEGVGGLHGWQWIFCLEGIATVLVAILAFFYMHDYPETAKLYIMDMVKQDGIHLSSHFDTRFVWQAMKDYKTYVQILIFLGLLVPLYAIALFSPTIINDLLLSVPPFVAGAIATVIVGVYSDKYNIRVPYIIGAYGRALICWNLSAAAGTYPAIPIVLAWAGSNAGGDLKRGVVLAMVIGLGNLEVFAPLLFILIRRVFHIGHGTIMGFLSLSIIMSLFAMWDYNRLNKKKEAQCLADDITDDKGYEFQDMGDASPLFR